MNETKSSDFFSSLMRISSMNVWKIRFELIPPKGADFFFICNDALSCLVVNEVLRQCK